MLNVDNINGFLSAFSALNCGADFATDYFIKHIPSVDNVEDSLDSYFNGGMWNEDSELVKEPVERPSWTLDPQSTNKEQLIKTASYWFFNLPHSPKVDSEEKLTSGVGELIELLEKDGPYSTQIELWTVNSHLNNRFYESMWDDFLIRREGLFYLLHFGVSD